MCYSFHRIIYNHSPPFFPFEILQHLSLCLSSLSAAQSALFFEHVYLPRRPRVRHHIRWVSIETVDLVYLMTPLMICSGGTAACVAAGRLAQAVPTLSILLVESGQNNLHNPTVVNPAMYLTHLTPGSQAALFYKANAEEALNGREAVVSAGGILGGGSSINFMMYTRARGIDFDDWKTKGWDSKSLLPYMKKVAIQGKYMLLQKLTKLV
jgi:hypothetical protein